MLWALLSAALPAAFLGGYAFARWRERQRARLMITARTELDARLRGVVREELVFDAQRLQWSNSIRPRSRL